MRVWDDGRDDAPLLLAIHGLGGSGRYWQGLADRLGDGFHVIAPDLAGFGGSDEPQVEADRAQHLADLDALIADATSGTGAITVVGHSLGAVLGVVWVAGRVGSVDRLALAAPAFPTATGVDLRPHAERSASRARRATMKGVRALWPLIALPVGLARGYPPATVVDFGRQSLRSRAWTMWSLWSDPSLIDDVEVAAKAIDGTVGTLVMHARDDRTVRFDAQASWAGLMPRAEYVTINSGGHQFLLRDRFEPLAGWLLDDSRARGGR